MNFIHIAGHLGADAEVRYTSSGKKVVSLRVGTKVRKGQKEETIWWRVTIWGEQYDRILQYLKKGTGVIVSGDLHKPEIYTDREGKPQAAMEITAAHIQFSPFGRTGGDQKEGTQQQGQGGQQQQAPQHPMPANPFNLTEIKEPPASPYMGGYAAPAGKGGETFDDEVPF